MTTKTPEVPSYTPKEMMRADDFMGMAVRLAAASWKDAADAKMEEKSCSETALSWAEAAAAVELLARTQRTYERLAGACTNSEIGMKSLVQAALAWHNCGNAAEKALGLSPTRDETCLLKNLLEEARIREKIYGQQILCGLERLYTLISEDE